MTARKYGVHWTTPSAAAKRELSILCREETESFATWASKRAATDRHKRMQAKTKRHHLSIRPALGDGSKVFSEGNRLVTVYPCGHRHSMRFARTAISEKMIERWQNSGAGFNVAPCSTCWKKGIYSEEQQALLRRNRAAYARDFYRRDPGRNK